MKEIKRKKIVAIVAALLILGIGLYVGYQKWFSATRIALVHYQNAQVAAIAKAANNDYIQIIPVDEEEMDKIKNCDAVLINGMGLRIDESQREILQKYVASGKPLHVFSATNPENKISSLDSIQASQINDYIGGGDKANVHEMLNYIRRKLDGKTFATHEIVPPKEVDTEVFTYPGEPRTFATLEAYETFCKSKNSYKEGAPKIVLLTAMASPLSDNTEQIDRLVQALQEKGMNVYPFAGMMKRVPVLQAINPNAVINFPHGRLAMMNPDAALEWLKKQNIPLFAPLTIMQSYDEWMADKMGMSGGFLSQSVIVPEMDGSILPYVYFTTQKDKDGLYPYKVIPDRLANFVDIVSKQVNLQTKSNAEKKVAIFYFKGPGNNSLMASNLEVLPSLYNVLLRLKSEGYKVENLPSSVAELQKMVQSQGSVFEPYAKGMMNEFIQNGRPTLVEKTQYESWAKQSLPENLYAEVVRKYGEAPGEYMAVEKGDKEYIAVARLDFGNVSLLPQPLPAVGDNTFQLVHGAKVAPPHTYIAPYLWMQHDFRADVVLHFGTHGSLEFTPGKSVALSNNEWSDRLIGNVPHFYVYTISNVGEGMIAKRRSYATLLSYLTPPFMESETRGQFKTLFDKIKFYHSQPENQQAQASLPVKKIVVELGLHRDLALDSTLTKPYTSEEIDKIENFAEEISSGKMTGNSYTMGVPYEKEKLNATTVAMSADPIAYSKAAIDKHLKKVTEKELQRGGYFNAAYTVPAKQWIQSLLQQNRPITHAMICAYAGVPEKDLDAAIQFEMAKKSKGRGGMPAGVMGAGSAAKTGKPSEMKQGGHPGGMPGREMPKEQKEYFSALLSLKTTMENVVNYRMLLEKSPSMELDAIVNALNGRFTAPSPGGDPIVQPNTLPTGRNLFSVNVEATPSETAWENGKKLAEAFVADYLKRHNGEYPHRVNMTLWSSAFIETEGAPIAQILHLLGVEPVRDAFGRVNELKLIPSEELGRPRIDVVVQTSGQLRDIAASRLFLINKAITMAAEAKDNGKFANNVAQTTAAAEKALIDKGMSPVEAKEAATRRIFGGLNGMFGTGITGMVQNSDKWTDEKEIADTYINNMGASYDSEKDWGEEYKGVFRTMLENTDAVVHSRQSNTWGALSLDHVYEFMGGVNLAVREVTGKEPEAYFSDYRNRHNPRVQELKESVGVEARTTILNPAYLKEQMKGGASSAGGFVETFENIFAWNVLKPQLIDKELWDNLHSIYVKDGLNLGIKDFFEKENPYALQEMTAVMMEASRKGYWKASPEQLKDIAELHTQLVEKFGSSGSGKTAGNELLQAEMAKFIPESQKQSYSNALQRGNKVQQETISDSKSVVLKKEGSEQSAKQSQEQQDASEKNPLSILLWVGGGLLVLIVLFALVRKKKK